MNLRILFTTLTFITVQTSFALAEEPKRLQIDFFCSYVTVFSSQIYRNKIRNVSFSRLDEFSYFEPQYASFLERVAQEIYRQPQTPQERNIKEIGQKYKAECQEMFNASSF